jgi:large subunit ribosomal protein L32
MAVPKRRHSKARKRKRHAAWKLKEPNIVLCPRCKEPIIPHRVCAHCGYYKERRWMEKKE